MQTQPIFNVISDKPPNGDDWLEQGRFWKELGAGAGAVAELRPLTIKLLYVTGIILAACRSVDILLSSRELVSTVYYPAYSLFASAIDLLGRCVRGNAQEEGSTEDVRAGFRWLAQPDFRTYSTVGLEYHLVTTRAPWGDPLHEYSISELVLPRTY